TTTTYQILLGGKTQSQPGSAPAPSSASRKESESRRANTTGAYNRGGRRVRLQGCGPGTWFDGPCKLQRFAPRFPETLAGRRPAGPGRVVPPPGRPAGAPDARHAAPLPRREALGPDGRRLPERRDPPAARAPDCPAE